jgi:hypothetical protein
MIMKKYVVIAMLAFCGACYQYSSFQPTSSTVGKAVRVQLTDQGTAHLAAMVGPGADYVDGNLSAMTDSSFTLSLTALGRRNGTEEGWKGEAVTVSHADVESIELRKASAGKSAALTAALVGGAALIARTIGGGEGAIRTRVGGGSSGQ